MFKPSQWETPIKATYSTFAHVIEFLGSATSACVSRDPSAAWRARCSEIHRRLALPASVQPTPWQIHEEYLSALHITQKELAALKIIHVTGTKGKGSTCAFCESILRRFGLRTGLYTSPHLLSFTERYRINGVPVSEVTSL